MHNISRASPSFHWAELLEQLGEDNEEDAANKEGEIENAPDENTTEISQSNTPVTIVDGDCAKYLQCLQSRSSMTGRKRDAVVVCINAGVGSAAVALKHLGVKVAKIIHVEADRVAQHVIRSNHDYCYGEIDSDDQIGHIVGLFENADITEDPEKLVRKYGPIGEQMFFSGGDLLV